VFVVLTADIYIYKYTYKVKTIFFAWDTLKRGCLCVCFVFIFVPRLGCCATCLEVLLINILYTLYCTRREPICWVEKLDESFTFRDHIPTFFSLLCTYTTFLLVRTLLYYLVNLVDVVPASLVLSSRLGIVSAFL
jgi:hypothetical protein